MESGSSSRNNQFPVCGFETVVPSLLFATQSPSYRIVRAKWTRGYLKWADGLENSLDIMYISFNIFLDYSVGAYFWFSLLQIAYLHVSLEIVMERYSFNLIGCWMGVFILPCSKHSRTHIIRKSTINSIKRINFI